MYETIRCAGRQLASYRMAVGHPTTLDQALVDAETILTLATDGNSRTVALIAKRVGLPAKDVCIVIYGRSTSE